MGKEGFSKIWSDQYTIHIYHIDNDGLTTMASLCDFLQESAWAHANSGKFGYKDLKEQNLFWVLSRLLIKVHRFPGWKEKINLTTWSKGANGVFADRDFEIFDEEGKLIVSATSAWLVLDSETRRIKRLDALIDRFPACPEKKALPVSAEKIMTVKESRCGSFFPVLFSDLDLNNHVNNARYIRRILDSFEFDFRHRNEPAEMEVNFLMEGTYGDELAVTHFTDNNSHSTCSIIRKEDEGELIRTRIVWRERHR